jgi:hypothetical protein
MEIWSIVREEHHRLEALVREAKSAPADKLIVRLSQELIAHVKAEEQTLDRALLSHSGFEKAIAEVHEKNRRLLALCDELDGSPPARRASVLDAIEAALAGHAETQNKMLPVAEHTLKRHAAERVKHEFESAKHARLERVRNGEFASASLNELPLTSANAASLSDCKPASSRALERISRQENGLLFVCETAINLLKHSEYRSLVGEIADEHLQKTREIRSLLGREPSAAGGKLAGWTKLYAAAVVGDKATLKVVRSAEKKARVRYQRLLRDGHFIADERPLLQSLSAAAHRHEDQIEAGLESTETAAEIAG